MNNKKVYLGLVFLILFIVLLIFSPFLCIWALNVLFSLAIPYTFKTWLAGFIIIGLFSRIGIIVKK
jgi:hypothetical protein